MAPHFFILLLASARGALLSVTVGLLILFFLLEKRLRLILLSCVLGALSIAWLAHRTVLSYFTEAFATVPVGIALNHTSGRVNHWLQIIEHWISSPWFGNGPMSYAWQESIIFGAHPHNFTLQILFEYGGLFLMVLFFLVLKFIATYIKQFTKSY